MLKRCLKAEAEDTHHAETSIRQRCVNMAAPDVIVVSHDVTPSAHHATLSAHHVTLRAKSKGLGQRGGPCCMKSR